MFAVSLSGSSAAPLAGTGDWPDAASAIARFNNIRAETRDDDERTIIAFSDPGQRPAAHATTSAYACRGSKETKTRRAEARWQVL